MRAQFALMVMSSMFFGAPHSHGPERGTLPSHSGNESFAAGRVDRSAGLLRGELDLDDGRTTFRESSLALGLEAPVQQALPPVLAERSGEVRWNGPLPSMALAGDQHPEQRIGERISIVHGSTLLSGSLLVPEGQGPHPALVAIEGSGDGSYQNSWKAGYFPFWKDIAEFLVARGYAVLLFDKPGVNASTGDWRRQSFHDRAEEAISAVRLLAARDDIDPTRVGLIGHSQGGWIAQIAAASDPEDVAFLVMLAGPAVSVKQQIRDDAEGSWTCRGVSGIDHAVRRAALNLWLGMLGLVANVAQPGYLSRIIHFDPRSVLPEIRQPILAIFAENDYLVEAEANRERLERDFGTAQNDPRLVIATVQGADHFFRASPRCPGEQRPTEWAPEFFRALENVENW